MGGNQLLLTIDERRSKIARNSDLIAICQSKTVSNDFYLRSSIV